MLTCAKAIPGKSNKAKKILLRDVKFTSSSSRFVYEYYSWLLFFGYFNIRARIYKQCVAEF
jgi:hypothetical protein